MLSTHASSTRAPHAPPQDYVDEQRANRKRRRTHSAQPECEAVLCAAPLGVENAEPQVAGGEGPRARPPAAARATARAPPWTAPPDMQPLSAALRCTDSRGLASRIGSVMDNEPQMQAAPAAARPAEPISRVQSTPVASRTARTTFGDGAAGSMPRTSNLRPAARSSKSGHPVGLFSRAVISKAEAAQAAIVGLRTAAPRRDASSAAGDPTYQRGPLPSLGRVANTRAPEQHELGGCFRQPSPAMSWEGSTRSAAIDGGLPRPSGPASYPFAFPPSPTPHYDSVPPLAWDREPEHSRTHSLFTFNPPPFAPASYPLGDELEYGEANTLEEVSALLASDLRRGPLWAQVEDGGLQLSHAWSRPPPRVEHDVGLQLSQNVPLRPQRYTDADGLHHYLRPFESGCRTDNDDDEYEYEYEYEYNDQGRGLPWASSHTRPTGQVPEQRHFSCPALRFPTVF